MRIDFGLPPAVLALAVPVVAALASAALVALLLPLLDRHLVGAINARSDHRRPTPHGGGAGVVAAAVLTILALGAAGHAGIREFALAALILAAGALGLADDVRNLGIRIRLAAQLLIAVAGMALVIPPLAPGFGVIPGWALAILGVPALVWAMNAVNFVDGSDLITAAHAFPAFLGFSLAFAALGDAPAALAASALAGAVLGFVPFNRPPARVFLGDVGSLPTGLALGLFAILLHTKGHTIAALAFIAYPALEATSTLLMRWRRGARLTEAHRDHAYQRARDSGWPAARVAGAVLAVSTSLAALGVALAHLPSARAPGLLAPVSLSMIIAAAGGVLFIFRNRPSIPSRSSDAR